MGATDEFGAAAVVEPLDAPVFAALVAVGLGVAVGVGVADGVGVEVVVDVLPDFTTGSLVPASVKMSPVILALNVPPVAS